MTERNSWITKLSGLLFAAFPSAVSPDLMSLFVSPPPPAQEASLTNGAPVETPSPASTSSLFNRLQLDDDPEADVRDPYAETAETRDLFVTVDDPKKHVSTMETYITYRVSTKVRRNEMNIFFFVGHQARRKPSLPFIILISTRMPPFMFMLLVRPVRLDAVRHGTDSRPSAHLHPTGWMHSGTCV